MPSTRDIRRRIKSIKNTSQITKAMQMVAASKMRKAQNAAMAGRSYAELMNRVLAEVTHGAGDFSHPLMETRPSQKRAAIVVTSDKGLCGALNSNLLREAAKYDKDSTTFIAVGRKSAQFISRTRRDLSAEFSYQDTPTFDEARAISKYAQKLFLDREVGHVDLLYTNFINTLTQTPKKIALLPVGQIEAVDSEIIDAEQVMKLQKSHLEFLFEPGAASVLGALLPHYLNYFVYQVLLEAKASEHSARMVAMKNATDNAKQLIKDLTLEYNKIRQANITSELLEITSAAMALG